MFSFFYFNEKKIDKIFISLSRQGKEAIAERKMQRFLQSTHLTTAHYFSFEKQEKHTVEIVNGKFYNHQNKKLLNNKFLYVMLPNEQIIYAKLCSKNNKKYFHSSLANGKKVLAAGIIEIENGMLIKINNESGHYKPTDEEMRFILNKILNETKNPNLIYESHSLASQKILRVYLASDFLKSENPPVEIKNLTHEKVILDEDLYETKGTTRSRYAGKIKHTLLMEKEPIREETHICRKYCTII